MNEPDKMVTLMNALIHAWTKEKELRKMAEGVAFDAWGPLWDAVMPSSVRVIGAALSKLDDDAESGKIGKADVERMQCEIGSMICAYSDWEDSQP